MQECDGCLQSTILLSQENLFFYIWISTCKIYPFAEEKKNY
jgi:hypothetical protein